MTMDNSSVPAAAMPHLSTLLSKLRKRQLDDAYEAAMYTLLVFQNIINACDDMSGNQYSKLVSDVDQLLRKAHPGNLIPGNICLRLTHVIREELAGHGDEKVADEDVKFALLDEIKGIVEEIKSQDLNFASQVAEHVHANEVVLTFGYSRAVFQFLRASKSRHVTVFVAENAPSLDGRRMVEQLQQLSIDATLISDAAVFPLMSRIHRVLLGSQSVTADGGAIASAGSVACALVAAQHQVPVCVCAGAFQFSQRKSADVGTDLDSYADPEEVWGVDGSETAPRVLNLATEFLPPTTIDVFITHGATFAPAHVVRFLAEIGME